MRRRAAGQKDRGVLSLGRHPHHIRPGVLGALAGVIGVLQAVETVKLLLGIGDTLEGHLMIFDALKMNFRKVRVRKDPECALCGENATIKELVAYEEQACEYKPVTCER